MAARERGLSQSLSRRVVPAAVAIAVFALAYADGGYSIQARAMGAVIVWWSVLLTLVTGVARVERLGAAGRWIALSLGAYAVWTLMSVWWSSSAEAAIVEFERVLLYLGIFLLVGLLARSGRGGGWADGLAIGIAAVLLIALVS